MFAHLRRDPTPSTIDKATAKLLTEKMLGCDYEKNGFKYASNGYNIQAMSTNEAIALIAFFKANGLTCESKTVNQGQNEYDYFIVFPEKVRANDVIDAIEEIFKPGNSPRP